MACEFGFLTVPEFAEQTLRTLATVAKLPRSHGHLLNWYDTRTLQPLQPRFVSSVDSGNLVASLWTLQQGCLDLLHRPLLERQLAGGLVDHLRILVEPDAFPQKRFKTFQTQMKKKSWLPRLLAPSEEGLLEIDSAEVHPSMKSEVRWFAAESLSRVRNLRKAVQVYVPWMLPEFVPLWNDSTLNFKFDSQSLTIERLPEIVDTLSSRLQFALDHANGSGDRKALYQRLQAMLPDARSRALELIEISSKLPARQGSSPTIWISASFSIRGGSCCRWVLRSRRESIASACYDLLASEARIAVFAAIAKEDIPQDVWFQLGRIAHPRARTSHPAFLDRHHVRIPDAGAVDANLSQHACWIIPALPRCGCSRFTRPKKACRGEFRNRPSPSGMRRETISTRRSDFPRIALRNGEDDSLVISPYSTFLALHVDPAAAMRNLRRMAADGWVGPYGFYEAADYSSSGRRSWRHRHELVRCWMAHHQGMSLLAMANFLHDGVVQRWFHNDRRVQATELLLHEKPATNVRREFDGTAA